MKKSHIKSLELDKVLALCSKFAISDEAAEHIIGQTPETKFENAQKLLEQTSDAGSLSVRFGNPNIIVVQPCAGILGRANRGATLSPSELLEISKILACTDSLLKWYRESTNEKTSLDDVFSFLEPNKTLEREIKRSIVNEEEIADSASPDLYNIRKSIKNAEQNARKSVDKIIRSQSYQKYLQDQIVTIRNGRFVVPVKAEHKNEIKGLVHDTSASGSTLFIEPMAVVELNNKIKELEIEEKKEVERILAALSALAAEDMHGIISSYNGIIGIDIIFARSKFGDNMKAVVPELLKNGETSLCAARHPLITADKVVPVDINIGGENDTLIITGPNTGGKTVTLKTLGLLTLMASMGMMIPALSRSKVRFFEKILADIGDEQSIEQSLSTFSGHMTNIIEILAVADKNSLVLIDELGAGTDPTEGAALAVAIISELRSKQAIIAASTHYAEIKMYALETAGVENASCEFDVRTLRPTYRLIIGTPGKSNAFAISERLGLSSHIIKQAEGLISTENRRFEDVVTSLEETRQALEEEKLQAQSLRRQAAQAKEKASQASRTIEQSQEKTLEQARAQARSMLDRVRFQSDQILNELEKLKKQKDKEGFAENFSRSQNRIKSLIGEMEESANPVIESNSGYKLPRELRVGDRVFIPDFNAEGTVTEVADNKGKIRVKAGIFDTKIAKSSVRLLDKKLEKIMLNGKKITKKIGMVNLQKSSENSANASLDIRGLDSGEAEIELMQFIDGSALRGVKIITVVHGKGTGALREMVSKKLRGHKLVAGYRLGGYGEGGDGATIVELK